MPAELNGSNAVHDRPVATKTTAPGHAGEAALRVEAHDGGPRLPQVRCPAGLEEAGRGLLLVEALSRDWGARPTSAGKAVWAEVAIGAMP